MSDSISTHEFCNHFVFKMAFLITNDCSRCSKFTQNISLNEPHHLLALFLGQAVASTHLDTLSITRRMYRFPNEDGNDLMKSIPHT